MLDDGGGVLGTELVATPHADVEGDGRRTAPRVPPRSQELGPQGIILRAGRLPGGIIKSVIRNQISHFYLSGSRTW